MRWVSIGQGGASRVTGAAETSVILGRLGGTIPRGGLYLGTLVTPATTVIGTAAGAFYASDVGADVGSLITLRNLPELGSTSHVLPMGGFYYLKDTGQMDDATPTPRKIYDIIDSAGTVGAGNAQYQVYQMTSATAKGWDWIRAHA